MKAVNAIVRRTLASPLHQILSGSTVVIRYRGRTSGETYTTPAQYARYGSALVIAVAHPERKTWWRNFTSAHRIDVLVAGTWFEMSGLAVDPETHPDEAAPLVAAYASRFPRAAPLLASDAVPHALLVWCRPVSAPTTPGGTP